MNNGTFFVTFERKKPNASLAFPFHLVWMKNGTEKNLNNPNEPN